MTVRGTRIDGLTGGVPCSISVLKLSINRATICRPHRAYGISSSESDSIEFKRSRLQMLARGRKTRRRRSLADVMYIFTEFSDVHGGTIVILVSSTNRLSTPLSPTGHLQPYELVPFCLSTLKFPWLLVGSSWTRLHWAMNRSSQLFKDREISSGGIVARISWGCRDLLYFIGMKCEGNARKSFQVYGLALSLRPSHSRHSVH